MNVLIATWHAGGSAQAAVGLGRLLTEQGHAARILCPVQYVERAQRAGCRYRPFPSNLEFDPALGRRLEDQRALMYRIFFGGELAEAFISELAAEPADVVVVDYLLRTMIGVAEPMVVPVVLLIHTIHSFHSGSNDAGERRVWYEVVNRARSEVGLPLLPAGADSVTAALVRRAAGALVAMPREFDDWPDPPANVVHCGAIEEADGADWESPWPVEDTRPLVVVSLGTTYMQQERVLERVLEALDRMAVRVLVLTGLELDPAEVGARPGVEVRRYVPHAAVLPGASLVVTHAGTGTLLAALSAGVPAVCLPLGRDQFSNARRVEALGVGLALSSEAEPGVIRAALSATLASSELRGRAHRMAALIGGSADESRAVNALERFAAASRGPAYA